MDCYCRACSSCLPIEDIISYKNMPKSAQDFPSSINLDEDKGVDIVLKECPYCGLVQAVGEPVPYYKDVIRSVAVSDEMKEFRIRQFSEWIREYHLEGKRVIEIGCGKGEYLALLEITESEAFGLEHNEESVAEAQKNGHNVYSGFIKDEQTLIDGYPYDAFLCLNYLEHIPEPGLFLKGIANNLADDSYGLVEVPNFNMMIEKSLYSEFIQDHLSYFTKDSLSNLLSNCGFEILSLDEIWYGYIISATVRKRRHIDIQGMIERRLLLKKSVIDFLTRCRNNGERIATWGAGHQALANLSLLEMKGYIDCVIDSAIFKQNKYTPATHLPIVGPEVLEAGNIDVVIIMAAGYSQEIVGIMEKKYPFVKKAILGEDFIILD